MFHLNLLLTPIQRHCYLLTELSAKKIRQILPLIFFWRQNFKTAAKLGILKIFISKKYNRNVFMVIVRCSVWNGPDLRVFSPVVFGSGATHGACFFRGPVAVRRSDRLSGRPRHAGALLGCGLQPASPPLVRDPGRSRSRAQGRIQSAVRPAPATAPPRPQYGPAPSKTRLGEVARESD